MKITDDEIAQLRRYRTHPDEDDIRYKQIIKQKLLKNNKIIYLLNNKELEDCEAGNDEYFGEDSNIRPFFIIPQTQTNVMNFICFECSFDYISRSNSIMKTQEIFFYILVEQKNAIEKLTSVARHDLIAAEIINDFNGCNDFGTQLKLVSNKPSVMDNNYIARTLIFHQETPNSITKNGKTFGLRNGGY